MSIHLKIVLAVRTLKKKFFSNLTAAHAIHRAPVTECLSRWRAVGLKAGEQMMTGLDGSVTCSMTNQLTHALIFIYIFFIVHFPSVLFWLHVYNFVDDCAFFCSPFFLEISG